MQLNPKIDNVNRKDFKRKTNFKNKKLIAKLQSEKNFFCDSTITIGQEIRKDVRSKKGFTYYIRIQ